MNMQTWKENEIYTGIGWRKKEWKGDGIAIAQSEFQPYCILNFENCEIK